MRQSRCPSCGARRPEFSARCGCGAVLPLASSGAPAAPRAGPLLSEPDALAGASVGPYQVLEALGRGGMGQVYRARHHKSGHPVALKLARVSDAGQQDALRREVRSLSRLRHPGIVRIRDQGLHEGQPWYAMELVEGQTLRRWAGQRASGPFRGAAGGLRLSEVLELTRRLCEALAYLHGEGLVHRDLKPENILIRAASGERRAARVNKSGSSSPAVRGVRLAASGWPVLVDFGLAARFAGAAGREALELGRLGAGTVAYMAPEQILGQHVDARADLYALGCILYELLTGRRPLAYASVGEMLHAHLDSVPEPPSRHVPGLPAALDELVLRLLEKSPRRRLGHADDVAAALDRLLGQTPAAGPRAATSLPKARAYLYRPELAGRAAQLGQLEALLDGLEAGRGAVALARGESGVGKTRLLLELARLAEGRGVLVLGGECVPGVASGEPRVASEQQSDSSLLATRDSQLATGSESAPAARGRSRHSPSPAAAGGPLSALRRPLQAIADRCRERGPQETERLLARRGKVLALYEPALASLPGQSAYPEPAELPADASRLRLFGYLAETLEALAESGLQQAEPVLLMLDDLQWADELTVGFLEYWLRAQAARAQPAGLPAEPGASSPAGAHRAGAPLAGPTPLLFVGAYRSEAVGAQHAAPLSRLIGSPRVLSIDLGRLEEPAVASIVGDMLALDPPPSLFVRHLARHSEGNPFFVAEYLRNLLEPGPSGSQPLLWRDAQGDWQVADPVGAQHAAPSVPADLYETLPLPRTLRELVARRLDGLGRSARRLVDAAAVLGRESEMDLLRPMAGAHRDAPFHAAVEDLRRRQVLEVSAPGRLRFVHDKIREVAYARLRQDRQKKLHRAAARSIEGSGRREKHLADLGHHWEQAGEPDQARPCYLAAARQAAARFDQALAGRLYRAYLRLAEEPTPESVQAHVELCTVLRLFGDNEDALQEALRAVDEARRIDDLRLESRSLRAAAAVYREFRQLETAQGLLARALELAGEPGDREFERTLLSDLGAVCNDRGRQDEALQFSLRALDLARQAGDRRIEGVALLNLACVHFVQGRLEEGWLLNEQALAVARDTGNRCDEAVLLGNMGIMLWTRGRLEEALPCLEQSLVIDRETDHRRHEVNALANLGGLYLDLGRPEQAWQLLEQAVLLSRKAGLREFEGLALCNLVEIESLAKGNLENAARLALECEELFLAAEANALLLGLLCRRGHIELGRGHSARDLLARIEILAVGLGVRPGSYLKDYISRLERAIEAFEAGEHHRLFRGQLVEDIPEGLRRWLRETGQLPASSGGT